MISCKICVTIVNHLITFTSCTRDHIQLYSLHISIFAELILDEASLNFPCIDSSHQLHKNFQVKSEPSRLNYIPIVDTLLHLLNLSSCAHILALGSLYVNIGLHSSILNFCDKYLHIPVDTKISLLVCDRPLAQVCLNLSSYFI